MNTKYILLFLLCILLASCFGEDRRLEYADRLAQSRWIKDMMDQDYYWYKDIDSTELNFYQNAELFFKSLLVTGVDKYSTVESTATTPAVGTRASNITTYGFEFYQVAYPNKNNAYMARVLYTLPNSPAESVGLQRGDWIIGLNDTTLNSKNIDSLYHARRELKLHIGYLSEDGKEVFEKETKAIPPGTILEDNPIYYSSVIEHAGKRIGYLVYNSFVSGRSDTDETYLNELSALSTKFKSEGVDEFILDLRYNLGGELNRPVPMMCSMLVQASNMGKEMGYMEFNDKNGVSEPFLFSPTHLRGGSNLDMSRVFVLTNKKYTASASEAVINFLDPYMDVVIVGTGTVGKNVGSEEYDEVEGYLLHPIVCKIRNSKDFAEYEAGFSPSQTLYNKDELQNNVVMYPLGDKREMLLSTALSIIDGTIVPEEPEARSASSKPVILRSSLDRKELPGVLIR